jgi:hypothetical protein
VNGCRQPSREKAVLRVMRVTAFRFVTGKLLAYKNGRVKLQTSAGKVIILPIEKLKSSNQEYVAPSSR